MCVKRQRTLEKKQIVLFFSVVITYLLQTFFVVKKDDHDKFYMRLSLQQLGSWFALLQKVKL